MKRGKRRFLLSLIALLAVGVVGGLLSGCTTTIKPPMDVREPVTVYVLDHGHTPSLVMPTPDGQAVRYAYGDWNYYARGNRNPLFDGVPALLWPTDAAVGRQSLARMPEQDVQSVTQAVNIHIDELLGVTVERERVAALYERLEAHFRERWDERLENPNAGLTFVPDERPYTLAHDSNDVVRGWLEQLGAETSGPFWAVNWQLASDESSSARDR